MAFSPKHSEIAWITGMNHDGPLLFLQWCNETVSQLWPPQIEGYSFGGVSVSELLTLRSPTEYLHFAKWKKSAKSTLIFSSSFTWWRMQAERQQARDVEWASAWIHAHLVSKNIHSWDACQMSNYLGVEVSSHKNRQRQKLQRVPWEMKINFRVIWLLKVNEWKSMQSQMLLSKLMNSPLSWRCFPCWTLTCRQNILTQN